MKLAQMTWPEAKAAFGAESPVAILPVGALEAHGPHMALAADVVIAEAMAEAGAARLDAEGWTPIVLPPLYFTAAEYASGFAGTITIAPQTMASTIEDIAASVARHGVRRLAIANAHLEPDHRGAIQSVADAPGDPVIVFPDITRRAHVARLTEEFQSGACHAGRYETSIVMARDGASVREDVRAGLAPNPTSLLDGIQAGARAFEAMGGEQAYFGYPADATVEEGRDTIATLGAILAEAVIESGRPDDA